MNQLNLDVQYFLHNGVVVVKPTATGRLASLVKKTMAGHERVWAFANCFVGNDDDGDERIDHHRRGLIVGNPREGYAFLTMCEELGLKIGNGSMHVPLANGQRREGRFFDNGKPFNDFPEEQQKLVRWDLPNRAQLEAILSPQTSRAKENENE